MTETERVLQKADALYGKWRCAESAACCQLSKTGREPWLYQREWELVRDAVPALPPERADGACPFLDAAGKRCTVYAARPFGCRTFFCEKGHGPSRHLAERTDALLRELAAIHLDDSVSPTPQPISAWVRAARATAER